MVKRITVIVFAGVALVITSWTTYWLGYARAVVTSRYSAYDEAVTDALMAFQLRHVLLARDPPPFCEVDLFLGRKMDELRVRASDLSDPGDITWKDVAFGLRELDDVVRSMQRPTVQRIEAKIGQIQVRNGACNVAN